MRERLRPSRVAFATVWIAQLILTITSSMGMAAVLEVRAPHLIQAAIDKAQPQDTVRIYPGTYHEALHVDAPQITLEGVIEGGEWPVLDGQHRLNDGIIASGSGFVVTNLAIRNYRGNGVMTQGASNVVMRHLIVEDTGIYGIYPTLGHNILVEDTVSRGIEDAAIYIGMCDGVTVRRNQVTGNVAGIELENSREAVIEDNLVADNTGGILVFTLPGLPLKETRSVLVRHNFVLSNNHRNFGAPGSVVANIPPGTGILILAADDVTIRDNVIQDQGFGGIVVVGLGVLPNTAPDPTLDPLPDRVHILDNLVRGNGRLSLVYLAKWYHFVLRNLFNGGSPQGTIEDLIPRGGDLVSNGEGQGNCAKGLSALTRVHTEQFLECPPGTGDDLSEPKPRQAVALGGPPVATGGAHTFAAVCAGCHAFGFRLIGPPLKEIQAKYRGRPEGIVAFATKPQKVRDGFPAMPSQAHIQAERLKEVAAYILELRE